MKTGDCRMGFGAGLGFGLLFGIISAYLSSPVSGGQARQRLADITSEVADSCQVIAADISTAIEHLVEKTESFVVESDELLRRKIEKFQSDLDQLGANEA